MPPRKRAANAPKPDPEQEPLETPVEDAEVEPPTGDGTPDGTLEEAAAKAPAESTSAKNDRQEAEQPCTDCFREGWPDGATSVGCAHGTWNRDL